jgi:hypothetical protein
MSEERRPDWGRRIIIGVAVLVAGIFIVKALLPRSEGPSARDQGRDAKEDPQSEALARLEKNSSETTCREVLQALDSGTASRTPRPDPSPERVRASASLMRLTEPEAESLGRKEFGPNDPAYLAECLLLRDGIAALEVKGYPPAKQAELAFAWVCRQIYVSDRVLTPAPPWWVLEAGSGTALDRAYVFLAALRQLGLDGCLVGPPGLFDAKAYVQSGAKVYYAPVRAVGVRVKGDVFLFDHWDGKPVTAGGKAPATLATVRSDPASASEWIKKASLKPDEVKTWEVFLAVPMAAVAPRLEWLEQQLASTNPVRLYVNAAALQERFRKEALTAGPLQGVNCRFWAPERDPYTLVRLLDAFEQEAKLPDDTVVKPRREQFKRLHFREEFIPNLQVRGEELGGRAKGLIQGMFRGEFSTNFLVAGSPRDHLLRGNFSSASAALTELKDRNEALRDRAALEGQFASVVEEWSRQANPIFADIARAEQSGDAGELARAKSAQLEFLLKAPVSEKMALYVRRQTSRLLSAEATYELALLVHEQAEREQARLEMKPDSAAGAEAGRAWRNAADWWQRYLDNYPELRGSFKDRDAHARRLLDRCKQFLRDEGKK